MATSPSPSTSPLFRTPHATQDAAIGPTIEARRLALGVYRWKLAALANIAPHTLGRIERGERAVLDARELQRIEYALATLEAAYRAARDHATAADVLMAS
jgi:hypothetical protein